MSRFVLVKFAYLKEFFFIEFISNIIAKKVTIFEMKHNNCVVVCIHYLHFLELK